jgi:hypothetical protein
MLGFIAHIDHCAPRVIYFSGNLISGYKASVTECDFKYLWRSVMRISAHRPPAPLPCIKAAVQEANITMTKVFQ